MTDFAARYADQNERDYKEFVESGAIGAARGGGRRLRRLPRRAGGATEPYPGWGCGPRALSGPALLRRLRLPDSGTRAAPRC